MSETINRKLNYTIGIRSNQIIIIKVKSSTGFESTITFVDTADYDKLQTNTNDN